MDGIKRAFGIGALAFLCAGSAYGFTVQQRLDTLRANTDVVKHNATRPTQKNISMNALGGPVLEAILTQYDGAGNLSPNSSHYPRHLAATGISTEDKLRDPAQDKAYNVQLSLDTVGSDAVPNTSLPYLDITLSGGGGGAFTLNNLSPGVPGSSYAVQKPAPNYVGLFEAMETGMSTFDERVIGASGLPTSTYGVFVSGGTQCDGIATFQRTGDHAYRVSVMPQAPCNGISSPGSIELDLVASEVGGHPAMGTFTKNAASNLNASIDGSVQLCPRGGIGVPIDPSSCVTFDYTGGQQSLDFTLANYTGSEGFIFGDGFESGDFSNWSSNAP